MCCLKDSRLAAAGDGVCVGVAICALVLGAFAENGAYKVLEQEPLLLDNVFAQELREEYHLVKNAAKWSACRQPVLFTGALLVLTLSKRGSPALERLSCTGVFGTGYRDRRFCADGGDIGAL